MRFRKYLFTTLAVISLLLTLYFINNIRQVRSRAEGTSEQAAASTGSSIAYYCILTPSLMALFGFSALAHHYHKGLKKLEVKDANPEQPLDPHLE